MTIILGDIEPTASEIVAAGLFCVAVLHTFSTRYFQHLARLQPTHAGFWHLLGEVEVVFGFWAAILLLFLTAHEGVPGALHYLESSRFTEPAFIFVIMVVAASRPVVDFAGAAIRGIAQALPLRPALSYYLTVLSIGPLLGSFITEPAAMTLSAMLLRERYFSANAPAAFKYATLGVLLVNVSIGGTLTPFAAPPILMVAERWGWDFPFMLQAFGWKAALAVAINAIGSTALFRSFLNDIPTTSPALSSPEVPWSVIAIHLVLLAGIVIASHHLVVFAGLFLLFLGFTEAYRKYQSRLILREGLLVGFFLGGLVVLGGLQQWWLQPLISSMGAHPLYYGATLLTAITDNAALTYLGSLVTGMSAETKYALVAGAVTGGGLTVIANAPNPAAFAILKETFEDGAISPLWLAVSATPPTLVAIAGFQLLPG